MPNIPIHPASASNFAEQFNTLFAVLFGLSLLFGGGVLGMLAYYAVRYRAGSSAPRKELDIATPRHEMLVVGLPLVLSLAIFAWGARLYTAERTIPKNATEIFVMGKQWMWHVYHPDGVREMDSLTLPVGQPVRLTMVSEDVIHSFYVPAFRVQYFVLPGRYTGLWFTPTKTGRFLLLCNQYCGMDHSRMVGHVDVLSQADYAKWLASRERPNSAPTPTVFERGRQLFAEKSCGSCHGAKDTAKAPSLQRLFGRTRPLKAGGTAVADADYLRNAMIQPDHFRLVGYPDSMPSYVNLDAQDVWALVKYLESQ